MAIPAPSVLILGMHRSGTSCLAGSLEARGLDLGNVSTSDPHNSRGNRENEELRELNEAVLEFSGGSWDEPPDAVAWNHQLRARRDALLAARTRTDGRLWGFKDPRTLVTLPFWLAALRQPILVATYRDPAATARSLEARSGMAFDTGLALWSVYNERLLALRRVRRFPILRFDVDAAAYRSSVDKLSAELGLPGLGENADFHDEALIHQEPGDQVLAARLAAQLVELEGYAGGA